MWSGTFRPSFDYHTIEMSAVLLACYYLAQPRPCHAAVPLSLCDWLSVLCDLFVV